MRHGERQRPLNSRLLGWTDSGTGLCGEVGFQRGEQGARVDQSQQHTGQGSMPDRADRNGDSDGGIDSGDLIDQVRRKSATVSHGIHQFLGENPELINHGRPSLAGGRLSVEPGEHAGRPGPNWRLATSLRQFAQAP